MSVDKDGDGFFSGKDVPVTVADPDDNDPKVGPNTATGLGEGYTGQYSVSKPSVSLSTEAETYADINAAYQAAFGENVPKAIAKAYYKEINRMQSSRPSGGGDTNAKVNVNIQGVSGQEIKAVLERFIAGTAASKVLAAETGDPKAQDALTKGNFGVTYTALKNAYSDNGIPFNAKSLGRTAVESLANPDKLDANLNLIKLSAKTYFPALAEKIDAGYSVKQLLSPYLQTRANILEEDADTIDIKQLQSVAKDPKNLMNLYDYEVSLRNDPKWRFTKNAQDSINGVAKGIAEMFGLVG